MIFLLAERPDERDIPDVISIIVVNEIADKRIRISLPFIHSTAISA
jgi:hypothetical protein